MHSAGRVTAPANFDVMHLKKMIKIDTQPVYYYSQLDEDHFFTWAQQIPCIVSIDNGYLHIEPSKLDEGNLRDLLAIMERYKLPKSQLSGLCNQTNEKWFKNPKAYWYAEIFNNA